MGKSRRIALIFLLLLFSGGRLFAQSGSVILTGKVVDAETRQPVPDAAVQLENTVLGTTSQTDGTFSIKTDSVPANAKLVVSHIGYQPGQMRIQPGQTNYRITLKPKINTISEVKITATRKLKPDLVQPETVVDYAIAGNRLFVLYWERGRKTPSLKMLDIQTDSLLINCHLRDYATALFTDCQENLHLLTAHTARVVQADSAAFRFYPPVVKADFERYLVPCLAEAGEHVYFRSNLNKGIITSFLAVNQRTEKVKLLRTIQDDAVLTMQQNEARFQKSRSGNGDPEMNMNRTAHTAEHNATFAQQFLFVPPYIPLLKVGKAVCLFDHLHGNVEFYERDSLTNSLPVRYHLQNHWAQQLLTDKASTAVYPVFQRNGLYELRELNLNTGELGRTYKIPNVFASRITVHNKLVYFLYKDPAKGLRQFLYKAPLEIQEELADSGK